MPAPTINGIQKFAKKVIFKRYELWVIKGVDARMIKNLLIYVL